MSSNKPQFCCLRQYTSYIMYIPVVEYLRDLSPHVVGAVVAKGAGGEGEGRAVRALDLADTPVTVERTLLAVVTQPQRVLHSLLSTNKHKIICFFFNI